LKAHVHALSESRETPRIVWFRVLVHPPCTPDNLSVRRTRVSPRLLRDQLEGGGVVRADNAEVATVEGCDPGGPEALCHDDHTGIRAAETQIGVPLDQFGDPSSVGGGDHLDLEVACSDGSEEAGLRCGTELTPDQIGGLCDDECGRYERARPVDRLDGSVVIRSALSAAATRTFVSTTSKFSLDRSPRRGVRRRHGQTGRSWTSPAR